MNSVSISKDDLIKSLTENRQKHVQVVNEANQRFRDSATQILEKHVQDIEAGRLLAVNVKLRAPEDHTADYDRAISMLNLISDDTITVTEKDFGRYVMDNWPWKQQFLRTATSFTSEASPNLVTSRSRS